jgi:hypothetical protein
MSMKPTRILAAVVLVTAALTNGCAYEKGEVGPPTRPGPVTATQGAQREILVVDPFADQRESASCGQKKNGFGINSAPIECRTPPGVWVSQALANGFAQNGYVVLPPGSKPGPNTYVVTGVVKEFFMAPDVDITKAMNKMNVSVQLDVTMPTGAPAERDFHEMGQSLFTAEDNNGFDKAADSATMQLVGETVEAVGQLIQHPDAAPGWHAPPVVPLGGAKAASS